MAKVEISVPGERIVEEFTALVSQPTAPTTARSPDVGLVEISHVQPTNLVPGPPGPPGPRGSRWFTGDGDPTITEALLGDMYLDDVTGKIWVWDGTAWVDTGTDLSPDASELLAKILTVDGPGSLLDADTLDGHDSTYFATDADMTAAEGRLTSVETKNTAQDANLATINADQVTQNNRMTAIEGVNTTQDTNIALKANIASPTFTGDPKAPTPATADNDTSIATTAYVKANTALISQFPEAPNDGLTYGRKNLAWATIVGGAVVSDAAPGAPLQNGQLWFKSNSGDTFIWVVDANSSQWVQQNVMPPATAAQDFTKWPPGVYIDYAGVAAPGGTVFCAGQLLSRTTYAALFTIVGTIYGAGDGSTTFAVPDLRGRSVSGREDMGGVNSNRIGSISGITGTVLGSGGGANVHQLTIAQLPSHTHAHNQGFYGPGAGSVQAQTPLANAGVPFSILATGSDQSHNNMQPTLICNKLITTGGV